MKLANAYEFKIWLLVLRLLAIQFRFKFIINSKYRVSLSQEK